MKEEFMQKLETSELRRLEREEQEIERIRKHRKSLEKKHQKEFEAWTEASKDFLVKKLSYNFFLSNFSTNQMSMIKFWKLWRLRRRITSQLTSLEDQISMHRKFILPSVISD